MNRPKKKQGLKSAEQVHKFWLKVELRGKQIRVEGPYSSGEAQRAFGVLANGGESGVERVVMSGFDEKGPVVLRIASVA